MVLSFLFLFVFTLHLTSMFSMEIIGIANARYERALLYHITKALGSFPLGDCENDVAKDWLLFTPIHILQNYSHPVMQNIEMNHRVRFRSHPVGAGL